MQVERTGKFRKLSFILCLMLTVCVFPVAIGCSGTQTIIYMYTEPVPEEANDWACDSFQVLAEIAGDFPEEFGVLPSGGPLVLGQGFFGYRASGNSWEKRNTVYYPVLQNGKIILFLTPCYDGEGWYPSMSGEMAEIFRRKLLERSSQKDIGIICSAADGSTVPEDAVVFAKSENTWAEHIASGEGQCVEITKKMMSCALPKKGNRSEKGTGGSFTVDADQYKVLEMEGCLDTEAQMAVPAWAECAGALIRYRTEDRTEDTGAQAIFETYGEAEPNAAAAAEKIAEAVNGETGEEYAVCSGFPSEVLEVAHNINNGYPFAGVWSRTEDADREKNTDRTVIVCGYYFRDGTRMLLRDAESGRMSVVVCGRKEPVFSFGGYEYHWAERIRIALPEVKPAG